MKFKLLLCTGIVLFILIGFFMQPVAYAQPAESFTFTSYKDVLQLFEQMDYTEKTWQKGSREVPRVYLSSIPQRWRKKHSKELETKMKKKVFFRILAPLILKANENVSRERERLLRTDAAAGEDQQWLQQLATKYMVIDNVETPLSGQDLETLRIRVDTIPPSLVMAQSIEESGWGTSRFADLGNAMFGQWTWDGNGITPKQQRKGKGNYKIAAFDTPLQSIEGYILNLNTNSAYASLREKRAKIQRAGQAVTGPELAETLTKYSERGHEYVKSLKSIISYNKLAQIDQTYLKEMKPIFLIPVGEGAN